jgi:hypothetical protein
MPVRWPPAVLAAAVLRAEDVSFVLVGSAALWLRGEQVTIGDLDVVIEPGESNEYRLRAALAGMACRPGEIPLARSFARAPLVSVLTSYGQVDCLLERGRVDWRRLHSRADVIPVAEAGVLVADAADTWALRHEFKE